MKVYILCPPNFFTGGPLGLHQLCKELNENRVESFIYYPKSLFKNDSNPVHENYQHFNNPYVTTIQDKPNNILIVPEIFTEYFSRYKNVKKVIWWLSIDNYFVYYRDFNRSFIGKIKNALSRGPIPLNKLKAKTYLHLAQSRYAMEFLKKTGLNNSIMLHDYIPNQFFKSYDLESKENIILYNPKKGFEFTSQLIANNTNMKFIPLINLKPEEVIELLKRSKIYIDFGEHPGRDRFPREAAILGNVIITGKDGSANNHEDINIPSNYKHDKSKANISTIIGLINDIIDDYQKHLRRQEDYYKQVLKGEEIFKNEVKYLIEKISRFTQE